MAFIFTDRESSYPNRYKVTRDNGSEYYIVLERADEPVVVGTPLNAETFNAILEDLEEVAATSGVPLPATAKVGQYVRVTRVSETGVILATEAVDQPTIMPITQAEYDALVEPDENTLYLIREE